MPLAIGAQGVGPGLRGQATNEVSLQAGACYVPKAGAWFVRLGPYCALQQLDPVLNIWMSIGADGATPPASQGVGGTVERYFNTDGVNWRIANQTGCVVGALLTNGGTGYTSAPTCTVSSGSAVFSCIVGGAVSTTVTVNNSGSNYTYPPIVEFDAPPAGGIPATGHASISGTTISVTVDNQGAGYAFAPTVYLTNDPRDSTGGGATATATLTGAATVTGVLVTDHGTAVTSVPTLSFTGGGGSSAAATALMCWTITAYVVATAGSGYLGATIITGYGGFPTTAAAYTNVATQKNLVRTRPATIEAALSGVGITATGQIVDDGGIYAAVPTALIITSPFSGGTGVTLTAAGITFTMGGVTDTFQLLAA